MVKVKINPPVESTDSGTPDQALVLVRLPKTFVFPVYAPPTASIREVVAVVRDIEPVGLGRYAVILTPGSLAPVKAGRKFTEEDPIAGLLNGRAI